MRGKRWIALIGTLACLFIGACEDGSDILGVDDADKTGVFYEAEMSFYVHPIAEDNSADLESQYGVYEYPQSVVDNMTNLLETNFFAETLLLNENGLPTEERLSRIKDTELEALTQTAKIAVDKYKEHCIIFQTALFDYEEARITEKQTQERLDELWAQARLSNPDLPYKPIGGVSTEIDDTIVALEQAKDNVLQCNQRYYALSNECEILLDEANQERNVALEKWRAVDTAYSADIERISRSTDFFSNENSFIGVQISVFNDEEYAKELRLLLMETIPRYVEQNMYLPPDYKRTECVRISRTDEIEEVVYKDGKVI